MMIVLLGGIFVLLAVLNWFGFPFVVSAKIREKGWCKQFQRGMAIPYAILGIGWAILGLIYRDTEVQNSAAFASSCCLWPSFRRDCWSTTKRNSISDRCREMGI